MDKNIKSLNTKNFKKKNNFILNFIKNFATKDQRRGLSHSLIQSHRFISDCIPECPSIDIWKYIYKPPKSKIIESDKPISTLKIHWKSIEARIISINLFGKDEKYYNGFIEFLDSFEIIKEMNNINEWVLDTFIFRVYVAKSNNKKKKNSTPTKFIKKMINRNVEIVYVDTNQDKFNLDGSFWRFLIMDEPMKKGEQLRFLCRDADWKMTISEALIISEWINSKYIYHRINLFPICAGPLLAGLIGGLINDDTKKLNIKDKLRNYPYRIEYGDDELFLRDLIWPHILNSNSILTHANKKDYRHKVANPYINSCFEPTNTYCKKFTKTRQKQINKTKKFKKGCKDILIPKNPLHYSVKFSSDVSLSIMIEKNPEFFLIPKNNKKIIKQMNITFK